MIYRFVANINNYCAPSHLSARSPGLRGQIERKVEYLREEPKSYRH
jgi:hypothetical protein